MSWLGTIWALLWIVVVGLVVPAPWRGVLAQEKMARHLQAIERILTQRPGAV